MKIKSRIHVQKKISRVRRFGKRLLFQALRANVLRPIDESVAQSQRARENEDSSERSRVRSLNDETVRAYVKHKNPRNQSQICLTSVTRAKPKEKMEFPT